MLKVVARAPAKLNLTFEIVGELPDGYHEVSTLMQAIDIEDELTFEFAPASELSVSLQCSSGTTDGGAASGGFPLDDSNLIVKAARLFLSTRGERNGLAARVTVDKQIPIAAGLAGGSADAAATMVALNYHYGHPFSPEEMLALAGKLGADVPFCLEGGMRIGRGRGDELEAVGQAGKLHFVVVKPRNLAISTAWVYGAYDEWLSEEESPDTGKRDGWTPPDMVGAVAALRGGDLETATGCFGDDLEPVVFSHHPELARLKAALLALGAWCCHLTGSGPTLYAVVPDREAAHAMRRRFLEGHGGSFDVDFLMAKSVDFGARLVGER